MKAIVYTRYGPPDVLHIEEIAAPVPRDNELLVRVHAAEVTKSDCELRSFRFPVKWFWLPLRIAMGFRKPKRRVLGAYFSGEVESVGKDVTKFRKGDRVFGSARLRLGAYGEYMCVPDAYTLAPKPRNASFAEAAAVPFGGWNALHFMRRANIRSGDKVLINGAGGSIGIFAVQTAKTMGAEVTAVDSAVKEELLRRIGADHFIDYAREDFAKCGETYDVIFNMVARSSWFGCMKALKPGGRYLMGNPRISDMLMSLFVSAFSDKKTLFAFAGETEEELLALRTMIEDGALQAVVDAVYPMERIAEAHQRVETEQRLGSVVLSVGRADER